MNDKQKEQIEQQVRISLQYSSLTVPTYLCHFLEYGQLRMKCPLNQNTISLVFLATLQSLAYLDEKGFHEKTINYNFFHVETYERVTREWNNKDVQVTFFLV